MANKAYLAWLRVGEELEDVMDADPPLGLLGGDHLDGGGREAVKRRAVIGQLSVNTAIILSDEKSVLPRPVTARGRLEA